MREKILFQNEEISLFKKHPVLVFVSGGPDSVFLFHEILKLKTKHDFSFDVLHINYNLRGLDSKKDEELVQKLCFDHSISLHTHSVKINNHSSLQNQARKVRFDFAKKVFFQKTIFVLAHHKDDQLETLIMKANRGSGIKGLSGIKRLQSSGKDIIFRPLLNLHKKEIVSTLDQKNIIYRKDSSNDKPKYYRNRVRLFLKKSPFEDVQTKQILQNQNLLSTIQNYIELRLNMLKKQNGHVIPKSIWDSLVSEIQFQYIQKLVSKAKQKNHFQTKHWQQIKNPGNPLYLKNFAIYHNKHDIRILKTAKRKILNDSYKIQKPGSYYFSKWNAQVSLTKISAKIQKTKTALFLSGQIEFPITIKNANLDDAFEAFGKTQSKPLKDFFKSKQISSELRKETLVAVDSRDTIIAILGVEIAESAKIKPEETFAYKISLKML